MKYISALLLAAAVVITLGSPALADLRSERALTAAQFRKAASRTTGKYSASEYSLKSTTGRSRIHNLVGRHARAAGVPVALALAIVQIESRFNPRARGRAGEVGLMQIKPATARAIGYKGSIKALYNPDTNLAWGMKYLAEAYRRGGGTVCGAVWKYHAGHYAKRMTRASSRYCSRVKAILRNSA